MSGGKPTVTQNIYLYDSMKKKIIFEGIKIKKKRLCLVVQCAEMHAISFSFLNILCNACFGSFREINACDLFS